MPALGLAWGGLGFESFPPHQCGQFHQATAQEIRPGRPIGFAPPKASEQGHQQVGLEERQRGGRGSRVVRRAAGGFVRGWRKR